jgi:hypothetical protein
VEHCHEGRLNAMYLIGTALVHIGAITQIHKIFDTQSANDIAAFWIGAILLGHLLHIPRSFTSEFWVWKLNCTVGLILCSIILGQVIHYG